MVSALLKQTLLWRNPLLFINLFTLYVHTQKTTTTVQNTSQPCPEEQINGFIRLEGPTNDT